MCQVALGGGEGRIEKKIQRSLQHGGIVQFLECGDIKVKNGKGKIIWSFGQYLEAKYRKGPWFRPIVVFLRNVVVSGRLGPFSVSPIVNFSMKHKRVCVCECIGL